MPELPEVETFVRALRRPLVGRTVVAARNDWPRHIAAPPPDELAARIAGRRIEAIDRRGKYLVFSLSDDENLIIHLKMTGHLSVVPADTPPDPYAHTVFALDDGRELRFRDPRKFGRVYLVRDPADVVGPLGPEPLTDEFTADELAARLAKRRRVLKPLLLDQTFIAGIGNIYADEALFDAGLRPTRRSETLSAAEIIALHAAIRKVLALGIAREGASISTYVKADGQKGEMQNEVAVFRRTGQSCYACGGPIERIVLGGRSTHYCPNCQH
ncbi:MAG: bifunctional DNA-formamidopyrimidine glycosylase/DNA-(apurinic or apyrimidinic site) lyase [Candidatus Promineofilum sp.]|nr:bifunctional DNA-formamidopyrimidine glycosylase/DNA-(apurinic or apyrimidinic site) lyase [Promineifilum sp.]